MADTDRGSREIEWTKVLRDPCYYQRNIGSVLSGAIKDAIDYIDAQGEKIDKLTTLNASLNEQNVSMAKDNTCLQAALGEAEWIIRLSKYKGEGPEEMQWGTRRWAFLDTPEAERGQKMAERLRDAEKYNCTDWVIDARDKQRKAEAEREDLRGRVEQLQVQLAGCLIAAEGATKDPAKQGDYGWSPAYQAVLDLRRRVADIIRGNATLDVMEGHVA